MPSIVLYRREPGQQQYAPAIRVDLAEVPRIGEYIFAGVLFKVEAVVHLPKEPDKPLAFPRVYAYKDLDGRLDLVQ